MPSVDASVLAGTPEGYCGSETARCLRWSQCRTAERYHALTLSASYSPCLMFRGVRRGAPWLQFGCLFGLRELSAPCDVCWALRLVVGVTVSHELRR